MNWIIDTYSDVYSTTLMQGEKSAHHAASAKVEDRKARGSLFGLFNRR